MAPAERYKMYLHQFHRYYMIVSVYGAHIVCCLSLFLLLFATVWAVCVIVIAINAFDVYSLSLYRPLSMCTEMSVCYFMRHWKPPLSFSIQHLSNFGACTHMHLARMHISRERAKNKQTKRMPNTSHINSMHSASSQFVCLQYFNIFQRVREGNRREKKLSEITSVAAHTIKLHHRIVALLYIYTHCATFILCRLKNQRWALLFLLFFFLFYFQQFSV